MASSSSFIALTVAYGFNAVLYCLLLLGGGADTMTTTQASQSGGLAPRLAAVALVPAALTTFTLTQLLMFAHLHARELVRATPGNGGSAGATGAVSSLVAGLAKATLLAATAAMLAGAVVQLGADGHLDRGRGDVARLNIK